jgi:hypothetical protein
MILAPYSNNLSAKSFSLTILSSFSGQFITFYLLTLIFPFFLFSLPFTFIILVL